VPLLAQPAPALKEPAKLLAGAELKEYIRANYTKYEYQIPMRDGAKLFTAVYVPKDDSLTYPMLFIRTPYSVAPYGADRYPNELRPSAHFVQSGYIFVYQDVRGRWMSEGEYVNVRPHNPAKKPKEVDESSDTYDTVDWLIKNVKGNNGKVGITGISYPGFYAVCGMIDAHPAVKAVSPQAPVTDWFIGDDFHHNGALFLPHAFNFLANFGRPRPEPTTKSPLKFEHGTPDGYDFFLSMGPLAAADARYLKGEVAFWNELMRHGTYDEFWQARNLRPHLKDIKPAVMTVGGWFDAEDLFGALETFRSIEANHPPAANHLVMGPWSHGGWSRTDGDALGQVRFNAISRARPSRGSCRGPGYSRPAPTAGGGSAPGHRKKRGGHRSTSAMAAGWPTSRPWGPTRCSTSMSAIPPGRCRRWTTCRSAWTRSTWSPTSGLPPAGRTCSST
jgi:hypothetical protein